MPLTEALISGLAKLGGLRIISRTSAMRYKGTTKSLPQIAQELNVDAVVEGSVLSVGQRVRITVQLISTASDTHIWAEDYDRDLQDVLLLQSEVAQAVAQKIQVTVTAEDANRLLKKSYEQHELPLIYLKAGWDWDDVRDHPGFQNILHQMNFPS
jgi:adenylate cyclase